MRILQAFFKALEFSHEGDEIGLRQFTAHVEYLRGKWVNDATIEKYFRICNTGTWDHYGIYRFENVRDGVYMISRKDPAPSTQENEPETDRIPVTVGEEA